MANDDCCKIDAGVEGGSSTCTKKTGGLKQVWVAVLCAITGYTESDCGTPGGKVVSEITLSGDADDIFYEIVGKNDTCVFDFEWDFAPDTEVVIYKESFKGVVKNKSAEALCALEALLGKEIVVIGKENGDSGNYIVSGLGGSLFMTKVAGSTGTKKTDSNTASYEITGELDKRHTYIWDTDQATTDALVEDLYTPAV